MNKLDESERLDRLVEKYPRVFAEATLPFGLQCGPGWDPLIASLCEQLDLVLVGSGEGTVGISQIKEKFGSLLFYYDPKGIDDGRLRESPAWSNSFRWQVSEFAKYADNTGNCGARIGAGHSARRARSQRASVQIADARNQH
ncbi:hypothetical protein [Schauerella aestuarii]|uniref:hypothetical protein n=1 Tax=Schauerella aestuarii TaxID=2511204 RepID=UPI001368D933|nr:hypothetical protein [Achromobacter aestuarii]MYZ42540.1 hypothetical protein [Achromobacter aestuarii]